MEAESIAGGIGCRAAELTTDILVALIGRGQAMAPAEIATAFSTIHAAIHAACRGAAAAPAAQPPKPAVDPRKSIAPDYIVCLEDGKKFKSLKRHLQAHYKLTPEEYRTRWGLAPDYPMVAPTYSEARSRLAKAMGLGHKRAA